ncbi:RNA-directed DNA polymerase from mobile element jockey, partial [Smittium culicis]
MDTPASKKFVLKLGTGFQHAKVTNSTGSRYNKNTVSRMIDHIYCAGLNSRPNWCTANRYLDLSDHMPITAKWTLDALEVPAKKVKINAKKLLLAENSFVSHNRFTVLSIIEMGLNELFKDLIDTVCDQPARVGALDASGETINSADRNGQHFKRPKKIADQIMNNDSKSYWRYIKSYTGKSFQSIADGPVYDKNKNLITEKHEKIKIWTNHFGDLAKDTTGNSRSADKWENPISSDCDYYPDCDSSVIWPDITDALRDTPKNKAPEADGVPSEVWKSKMAEPTHTSSLAKLLSKIINIIYGTGGVPKCLGTFIVVTLCYIDYSKAYDRVPHMALLHKLRSVGIGGKLLNMIKGMYNAQKIAARVGNEVSNPTEYLSEVRQGCPASPILFDFYINDIFKGVRGVRVPGLTSRIPVLLFADDAVLLAESSADLQAALNTITEWSDTWEMAVNASKCGIMTISGELTTDMTLQGQKVNSTDQYTYLGYIMNSKRDVSRTIKNNKNKVRKAVYAAYSFLRRSDVLTALKIKFINSVLLPIGCYVGEKFVMSEARCKPTQSEIDKEIRMVANVGKSAAMERIRDGL